MHYLIRKKGNIFLFCFPVMEQRAQNNELAKNVYKKNPVIIALVI